MARSDTPPGFAGPPAGHEVLETGFAPLDPVAEGFAGVFFELRREGGPGGGSGDAGGRYVVELTSAGTGARLLRFRSAREELARALYEELLPPAGPPTGAPGVSHATKGPR